ncbi:hypothetical protein BC834DRAFT_967664 [Gloeopeniophorella convolvens]|nr:hypothetical protein BC834DRAFT_967664 [Gloeopeniophorella convolvens]
MTDTSIVATSPVLKARKRRTLVLCFDGTTNAYGDQNTNVVKLYSLLTKDRVDEQLCYYQASPLQRKAGLGAGIGTYFKPGAVSPLFRLVARVLDEAIAWYLSTHVMDGYRFLMQNYKAGDKVCLFGFSRGAYTARALAGMLHKVGLLSKDNPEQVPFAYKLYKSFDPERVKIAEGFKRSFCRDVPIEFLGVWDTVASVGIVKSRTLPFVATNTTVKTFRQALSLDERRAKFRPSHYQRPAPNAPPAMVSRAQTAVDLFASPFSSFRRHYKKVKEAIERTRETRFPSEAPSSEASLGFTTNAKEVWFAGDHCDVGGGNARDADPHALSNIPLRWMVREIMLAQCDILLDNAALKRLSIPITIEEAFLPRPTPDLAAPGGGPPVTPPAGQPTLHKFGVESAAPARAVGTVVQSPAPSPSPAESRSRSRSPVPPMMPGEQDALDAAQRHNDCLRGGLAWWVLELVPTYHMWQNERDEWVGRWSIHFGGGRMLPPEPMFHESVRTRMQNAELKYVPNARYKQGTEKYVL